VTGRRETDIGVAAGAYYSEIVGFTAPVGTAKVSSPVALDDDACVQAKFYTHKTGRSVFEAADVTALVSADHTTLEIIAKITTRLAQEAFRDGVRWQQQRTASILGVGLLPEGD
jgi:hypothetical protein